MDLAQLRTFLPGIWIGKKVNSEIIFKLEKENKSVTFRFKDNAPKELKIMKMEEAIGQRENVITLEDGTKISITNRSGDIDINILETNSLSAPQLMEMKKLQEEKK